MGYRQSQARPLVNPYVRNSNRPGILLSTISPGSARSVAGEGFRPRALLPVPAPALPGSLEQQHRRGGGDVQRIDPAPDRDRDEQIAALRDAAAQASALASEHQ